MEVGRCRMTNAQCGRLRVEARTREDGTMTFDEFLKGEESFAREKGNALHALWLAAKGDWDGAHEAA